MIYYSNLIVIYSNAFRLAIISDKFEGVSSVKRHQMIYKLLNDELRREGGIHALSLKTATPKEAN